MYSTLPIINGCGGNASRDIVVAPGRKADFVFYPYIPEANEPVRFISKSVGITHYRRNGLLRVCLTACNDAGCGDFICTNLPADKKNTIGLPAAFTPNGDGTSDVLPMIVAGIRQVYFVIYNRRGQKVFERDNQDKGLE